MTITRTLTNHDIAYLLLADDNASWTRGAANGIAEYLQQLSDDIGEPIEFDRVAIRCDYSEYTFESIQSAYSNCCDFEDCEDNDDVIAVLADHTCIVWHDEDTIVIQDF